MKTELEKVMEKKLIEQLTTGVSQWTYRPDLRTEAALWENLREKLNQNNKAKLEDVPITDAEFAQIKNFLLDNAATTYKAALFLKGENGEAFIPLVREDAKRGTIHLMVVNSREIAGGRSSYEIINQFAADKKITDADRSRRFDLTLLINGLPMIHIELKSRSVAYMEAFRQIEKYRGEGVFQGLFGFVQMFVVTNGSNTRYIAADSSNSLNENFLTTWVNHENKKVENYLDFAAEVLKIPTAHELIGNYSVLDDERKKLIILRPYQIHAIDAVKEASKIQKSGYVWHTTGSGKTLTSYTVTKNLLQIASVDKTIFLVDRKDLDTQTSTNFKSYAENDFIDVDNTENTYALLKKLLSKDRIAIVTTIQKLQIIMKRYSDDEHKDSEQTKILRDKHIAFVVDECHRTVTPETHRNLSKFFNYPLWYGFTGTPIFDDNARQQKGDLSRTTEQLFGKCLHKYTIKEALRDNAVLGFQVDYKDYDGAPEEIFKTEQHKLNVIDTIINHSSKKFNLSAKRGESYEAILTVDSIAKAVEYYKLIKKFIAEGKVNEEIRAQLNDFPKVAITYSVTENEENSIKNQEEMQESLDDYNKMFGTNFTVAEVQSYNSDLLKRLSRKTEKYKSRKEQLDLIIVVDRLLTGFDAPSCAILFLDRPPLAPHHLVQAFSRTNRIFDKYKRYGMIIIFQYAEEYKNKIDAAFTLYSNGGTNDITAPPFEETERNFIQAVADLKKIASTPESVDELENIYAKKKFAKAFQVLDKYLGEIQVYSDWENKKLEDYGITAEEIQNYSGKYQNVLEEIRRERVEDEAEDIIIDVEYELETIRIDTIDYRYIVALIQKYIPEDEEISETIHDEKIDNYIKTLSKSNAPLSQVVGNVWDEIKKFPARFKGMDAFNLIENRINNFIDEKINKVVNEWCLDKEEILYLLYNSKTGEKLNPNSDFEKFKLKKSMSKLKYRNAVRKAVGDLLEELKVLIEK